MLLTTDMVVREAANGVLALAYLYLIGAFVIYLKDEYGFFGPRLFYKGRNQAAIGFLFLFSGGFLFHGWIWYLLLQARVGVLRGFLADSYMVIIVSSVSTLIGAAFVAGVFTTNKRASLIWLSVVLGGAIMLYFSHSWIVNFTVGPL